MRPLIEVKPTMLRDDDVHCKGNVALQECCRARRHRSDKDLDLQDNLIILNAFGRHQDTASQVLGSKPLGDQRRAKHSGSSLEIYTHVEGWIKLRLSKLIRREYHSSTPSCQSRRFCLQMSQLSMMHPQVLLPNPLKYVATI